jgi:25S rRNA (uracil2634-N3)-methyltransferase
VRSFLHNASHLIRPNGEIHVTHEAGFPYDKWDIEKLALESSLIMVEKVSFRTEDYPGYNQKKGDRCRFKFCIGDSKKLKSVHRNRISSTPSLGSSTWSHPQLPEAVNTVEIAKSE